VRLSAEAMNAALEDFRGLQYATNVASAYDVFLAMKWVEANRGTQSLWHDVPDAVQELFVLYPQHPLGRLKPCRYDWLTAKDSGRKTVWNQNTRDKGKLSSTLLVNNDIRDGLRPDAAQVLGALLPSKRPSSQALAALVLRNHEFPDGADWVDAEAMFLIRLGLTQAELQEVTTPTPLGVPLLGTTEWDGESILEDLRPPESRVVAAPAPAAAAPASPPGQAIKISVDSRVERMLRLAITTTASVLLVGPPGTGKGTLLNWLMAEVRGQPQRYGFEGGFDPDPMWRTPDESWSAFELIGGLAPDSTGNLGWSSGALLDAIDGDRWLVLDETNRGDMDKIMGPLLTWLSDQEVEVGRSTPHGGKPIAVGWGNARRSTVDDQGSRTRYLAGTDFRLLGTYNPQDAQRVFRFGQALSRRFVVIPVPAVRPGQFTEMLQDFSTLPPDTVDALTGLYSAHLADEVTALGPAVFLRMAKYLVAGLPAAPSARAGATEPAPGGTTGEANPGEAELAPAPGAGEAKESEPAETGLGVAADGEATPPVEQPDGSTADDDASAREGDAPSEGTDSAESPLMRELLAEAYLIGVGRYLAGFEDRVFQALGNRIVNDEAALPQGQWTWVTSQRNVLS
jgi:MoxR-like ATPase